MDEESRKRVVANEVAVREMQRKSQDTWRIYNPLNADVNYPPNEELRLAGVVNGDFVFFFDGYPNIIKSHQAKDIPFYMVRHYFKAIADFMIGQMGRAKGEQLIEKRRKDGIPEFLDKYVENKEVWEKVPPLNDPELLKAVADQVILGKVSDYGLDIPLPRAAQAPRTGDTRALHDQILGYFDKKLAEDNPVPQEPLKEAFNSDQTTS